MSFFNRVLNQFINVIEWTASDNVTLVHRFDTQGREIMMGAQLTVRESQIAVFINEGRIADIYPPGRYELSTENMPVMTILNSWKYGFNSPFKAEVYFVNMIQFTDRKWGTTNPVMMRDADFGMLRLRAFGVYAFRVGDPEKFLLEVFGTKGMYKVDDIDGYVRNIAVSAVSEAIAKSGVPALDLAANYQRLSEATKDALAPKLAEIGLNLTAFYVENISLPPEVEKTLDTRTSMGVLDDMGRFTQYKAAEALGDAAKNPGSVGASLGVGLGAGQVMAQAMAQSSVKPHSTAISQIDCPACGKRVNPGKFCSVCGASLIKPQAACITCGKDIPSDAKFCPECGKPQQLLCPNCQKELTPGTKFCSSCGTKVEEV